MHDPGPPAFDDLYDEVSLALIDCQSINTSEDPSPLPIAKRSVAGRRKRAGLAGAILVGAMIGLAEVLEPERVKDATVQYADADADDDQPVRFELVPGLPQESRIVIRN